MSFRPSFRLTSLAAGLLLAVAATAQPVFDQPANATFKGEVVSRGENVVPGSTADVVGRGFVPGQKVSLLRGDSVLNAQPVVVDADGNFKTQLSIPTDAVPGTHPVVVRASQPAAATVLKLRVSPQLPLSGQAQFATQSNKLVPGLYQSAYSAASNAVFVTSAVGRPPVTQSQLLKLDPETLKVTKAITPAQVPGKDAGVYAVYGVGVDDRNGTVWTTNTRQNTVAVYRQSDLGLVKQFEPGLVPHAHTVVVDEKLDRAFASAAMTPDIVSFDAKTPAVRKHIAIESGVRGEQFAVVGMHLDPAVHKLYAVSLKTNEAAVIDAKTEQVEKVFPIQGAKTPMGVAHDPQTDRLFITAQGSDNLLIVDAKTGKTLHNVTTGAGALNVAFDPVKRLAYVTNRGAGTLTVVDPDGTIKANLELGTYPNHAVVDGKGVVYAVNKAKGQDDAEGDRITRVVAK